MTKVIDIISLGAGVQSSVMALMASRGELGPMPVAAVFADTQAEPASVYNWLDWLEKQLAFPVIRATAGDLAEASTRLRTSKRSGNTYLTSTVPGYTLSDGKRGMLQRRCTRDFKLNVIFREVRKLKKAHGALKVRSWIGISTDEASRMKPSPKKYVENIWPLIDANMSRTDCLAWASAAGLPQPPKSSCAFCPYHSDAEWSRLKTDEPAEFNKAVEYERLLSSRVKKSTALRVDALFLHASRVPLDSVDFRISTPTVDLFGDECEGMCGV